MTDHSMTGLTDLQKIKIQASIEVMWLGLTDQRRYELRIQGMLANENFTRFRPEGKAIWVSYAGEDIGVIEADWLWDDTIKEMPKAQFIPLDAPDVIPPEWNEEN